MTRRWSGVLALGVLAAGGLAGCEFDKVNVPTGKPRVVVHAVLDPSLVPEDSFDVLVERTLTGHVTIDTTVPFDPDDPIRTGSGEPLTGALVRIRYSRLGGTDLSTVVPGIEVASRRTDGKGRGVYRFVQGPSNAPNAVRVYRGGFYRIEVLADGPLTTGTLRIPDGIVAPDSGTFTLDREHDTLRVAWQPADFAKRYLLRVETPYGPFTIFSDALSFAVHGGLRNVGVAPFPRVLVPGFEQSVVVAAVDTNYFDYYRSANNPFTGSGIINHLEGGIGVFGAFVPLRRYRYEVVAPVDEPIEGRWTHTDASGTQELTLYADGALLSGRLTYYTERVGVLGSRDGTRVRLAVLRNQSAADTLLLTNGQQRGDSLMLSPWLDGGAPAVFRKAGAALDSRLRASPRRAP